MEDLTSVQEWFDYISEIAMEDMISHAKVIGSISMQEELESQGYDDDDIMAIYQAVAKRFLEYNIRIPEAMSQSCVDFRKLAKGILTP
tara:strand:+ start:340 stop:603 length:264 start_codon:yes stop_codon:yes gene_type:complete